jgi:hypothetical protein
MMKQPWLVADDLNASHFLPLKYSENELQVDSIILERTSRFVDLPQAMSPIKFELRPDNNRR